MRSKFALRVLTVVIAVAGAFGMDVGKLSADPLLLKSRPLALLAEQVSPAVVNIAIRGRLSTPQAALREGSLGSPDAAPRNQLRRGGSGVIIDAREGYIVTTAHLLEQAEDITVTLRDGRQMRATPAIVDIETDLAVIVVPAEGLTAMPLGLADNLEIGDQVLAICNPFGTGQSVTSGFIKGLWRFGLATDANKDLIQTDAPINVEHSGGALTAVNGELVGINTIVAGLAGESSKIGFAIPINMVHRIASQLPRNSAIRGQLGVQLKDLAAVDAAKTVGTGIDGGLVIAWIEPNSPAYRAGLAVGDIVAAMNGEPVSNTSELRKRLAELEVGALVNLEVKRKDRTLSRQMTLGPRPDPHGELTFHGITGR